MGTTRRASSGRSPPAAGSGWAWGPRTSRTPSRSPGTTPPSQATPDSSESTPEVLRGITRLSRPITLAFAAPAVGLILYGCPWILGDRTLVQQAIGRDRNRERIAFNNPYLERFKRLFPRGRVF